MRIQHLFELVKMVLEQRFELEVKKAFPLPGGRWPSAHTGADEGGYRGCGGHRTGGHRGPPLHRVTMDFVGADLRVGPSLADAPPWSPSSVMAAPCHLLPCGAKAIAVLTGALKSRYPSPHPSRACARATFPRGKAKICRSPIQNAKIMVQSNQKHPPCWERRGHGLVYDGGDLIFL